MKIAYITDDLNNRNIKRLIDEISLYYKIKVVTTNNLNKLYNDDEIVFIDKPNKFKDKIRNFFFLFSKICKSKTDREFPKRNLYRRYKLLINFLHYIKLFLSDLNLLPTYSDIVKYLYSNDTRNDKLIQEYDLFIVDSLLINTRNFHPLIGRLSKVEGKILVADIYSWDNVHYSSIIYFANYYFLWNEELKNRLIHDHPKLINRDFLYTRPLYMNYLYEYKPKKNDNEDYILYAAVYCDEILGKSEIELVKFLGDVVYRKYKNIKLYFRPYPSMQKSFYEELYEHPIIKVIEYGYVEKRYDDQEEEIRVDTNLEDKVNLIYNAKAFISLGSTFTLEVAYFLKPIIQLNFDKYFMDIAIRLSITDHLLLTFLSKDYKNIVSNIEEFEEILDLVLRSEISEHLLEFSKYLKNFTFNNCGENAIKIYVECLKKLSK